MNYYNRTYDKTLFDHCYANVCCVLAHLRICKNRCRSYQNTSEKAKITNILSLSPPHPTPRQIAIKVDSNHKTIGNYPGVWVIMRFHSNNIHASPATSPKQKKKKTGPLKMYHRICIYFYYVYRLKMDFFKLSLLMVLCLCATNGGPYTYS